MAFKLIALLGVMIRTSFAMSESLIGDNESVRNRTGMSQSCGVFTAEGSLIDTFE